MLMYGNSSVGLSITFFCSSILTFGFESTDYGTFKIVWWVAMCLVVFVRLADVIYWHKTKHKEDYNGKRAIKRYTSGVLLTGVMWCTYSLVMLKHADIIELASNIIIVSSLAGGAATILAAHRATAIAYSFLLLIPYSAALILSFEDYKFLLGTLGLCFGAILILTSKKSAEFTQQALMLKNENEALLHSMEAEVESRTRKIYELSNLDPLTGLLNRTAFLSQLETILQESEKSDQSLALLFIDLDKFKKINDAVGHETGDQVLMRTAKRLKKLCSKEEALCRWGGDEFIKVLTNTNRASALEQSAKIIEQLSKPLKFNQNRLSIGATIGIAMFPEHSRDAAMLIRLADAAMYDQKSRSPSKAFIFSEELGKRISREHRLKAGLSQAIKKKQLRLAFQPIVWSKNGGVVAFEALLRWKFGNEHIYPNEFIPIAEQYGIIQSIGAWVLDEACKIASSWDKAKQLVVTVNVSVLQLQDENFIDLIEEALQRHQLPANLLAIEITESVLASDPEIILDRINRLKALGVLVAIDDFGTGYSSLSSIQEMPVDIVKIDRSFIGSINTKGVAIVRAIMDISPTLDCLVIAEGVENAEQAEKLSDLGVHSQQGYFFARPMEYDQINGFLGKLSKEQEEQALFH